jgi:hypothetical protein
MSNLKIWDECKHIESKHLKGAKVNGNQCTTVNGLEMVRIFTKAFGPIGGGWWYEVAEERFDEMKPIVGFEPLMELLHTVKLRLHVKHGDEWKSFEQYGHTKARYLAGARGPNPYIAFDEEYAKKSTTDALKKCLSLLGVAADVYTGQIDDHQYMAEVADKQAIEKADDSAAEQQKAIDDIKSTMDDALSLIEKMDDKSMINRSIKQHKIKLSNRLNSQTLGKAASHALAKIETATNDKFKED